MARMRILQSCVGRTVLVQKSALLVMLPEAVIWMVNSSIRDSELGIIALSPSSVLKNS